MPKKKQTLGRHCEVGLLVGSVLHPPHRQWPPSIRSCVQSFLASLSFIYVFPLVLLLFANDPRHRYQGAVIKESHAFSTVTCVVRKGMRHNAPIDCQQQRRLIHPYGMFISSHCTYPHQCQRRYHHDMRKEHSKGSVCFGSYGYHDAKHKKNNNPVNDELMELHYSRRHILRRAVTTLSASLFLATGSMIHPNTVLAEETTIMMNSNTKEERFITGAYGREEYTNSIVASSDTNISPREVYDSIQSQYLRYPLLMLQQQQQEEKGSKENRIPNRHYLPRALDMGAGAGVSTRILWDMGYRQIDAVDWSGMAWHRYVTNDPRASCPKSVQFYELDDERYLDQWYEKQRRALSSLSSSSSLSANDSTIDQNYSSSSSFLFDVIVFNFAVNESKAKKFATELLSPNGRLLAPVNTQSDYWLKQTYRVYDKQGKVLWNAVDVGAWSVQFQPDVTQDTCQGVWCAPFNGFQKKR